MEAGPSGPATRRIQMKALRISLIAAGFLIAAAFVPLQSSALQTPASQDAAAVTTGVREAAWSPDGKRIAVTWYDAIWTMGPDGKDPKRLVPSPQGWAAERDPVWSPDGKSIAFSASTNGEFDVWIAPTGGGQARRLTSSAGDERWPSFALNGQLLCSHRPLKGTWRLVMTSADGKSEPAQWTRGDAAEWHGRVSPDGKLVAYVSDRDLEPGNEADIWVRELSGSEGTTRHASAGGGELPGVGA